MSPSTRADREAWLHRWAGWLPALWLLANCIAAVFFTEIFSPAMFFACPCTCAMPLLEPAWYLAVPILLYVAWRHDPGLSRRLLASSLVVAGAVIGWEAPTLGPILRVFRQQDELLGRIHAAMQAPAREPSFPPGPIEVDRSDTPPVRAAVFWFAAHGDVSGVVYDPTGTILDARKSRDWLYGSSAWHLYGPWYGFAN